MKKPKINYELLKIMEEHNLFMSNKKQTTMPLLVSKEKPNHKTSLYVEQTLLADSSFGETSIDCEVRDKNPLNYSFQILSNRINNRVIARLDEGNGVHRNNLPHIPLAEQEVTTPHFHKYDKNGYFVAYKTDALSAYDEKPLDIEEGLRLFCEEEKIESSNSDLVDIQIKEEGALPIPQDTDPLNGIMF